MAVIAVTGLRAEARIARRAGLSIVCAGGVPARTAAALNEAIDNGVTGLVSFGMCGGLAPALASGTLVCARTVIAPDGTRYPVDEAWRARITGLVETVEGDVLGSDAIVGTADEKAVLHARTGAIAVDLESAVVAEAAARKGLPFIVIRAIADPAECDLPSAAHIALTPDGAPDIGGILASVLREPSQISGLVRLAREARLALRALARAIAAAGSVLLAPR
jgi:adenosylhomocysteine nucleosidase